MLRAFSRHNDISEWRRKRVGARYVHALMEWQKAVEECYLEHHFIPGDNLLDDMKNLQCGKKERKLLLSHLKRLFDRLKQA